MTTEWLAPDATDADFDRGVDLTTIPGYDRAPVRHMLQCAAVEHLSLHGRTRTTDILTAMERAHPTRNRQTATRALAALVDEGAVIQSHGPTSDVWLNDQPVIRGRQC